MLSKAYEGNSCHFHFANVCNLDVNPTFMSSEPDFQTICSMNQKNTGNLHFSLKNTVCLPKLVVHRNLFSAGILFFKFDSENT